MTMAAAWALLGEDVLATIFRFVASALQLEPPTPRGLAAMALRTWFEGVLPPLFPFPARTSSGCLSEVFMILRFWLFAKRFLSLPPGREVPGTLVCFSPVTPGRLGLSFLTAQTHTRARLLSW